MNNKIFSLISIGIVVNFIIISCVTTCYIGFIENNSPLTHISKGHSVINISGY